MSAGSLGAALLHGVWAGLPLGAALGIAFGPLRLGGTDFSKWFADPGEVREGADHTWIGMMKWTALFTAKCLAGAALALLVWAIASHHSILWWSVLGLLAGVALSQVLVELTWRQGLRKTEPRPTHRLTRARAVEPENPKPPVEGRRRLVICCDGTWNTPVQGRETNVVALLRAIRPTSGDGIQQIIHYHLGVGTGNILDWLVGGGAGLGLSNSVKACYGFLADNYRPGDEILLFGFSRGAYVARSIAGMIGCVGLLRKDQMHRFIEAWGYYTLTPAERSRQKDTFDRIFHGREDPVEIRCIGVWDTVGALGIPGTRLFSQAYAFHETKLGKHVHHAYQALALDERRGNFQPAIWVREANDPNQRLEQMWFPGVHSNIGGGYEEHGLSDATLLWMLSRVSEHRLLDFDPAVIQASLGRYCVEPYAHGILQDSRQLFWKMISSPIPRPVCITDPSEKIHDSARERTAGNHGDPYAGAKRRNWLADFAIDPRDDRETDRAFHADPPGEKVEPAIVVKTRLSVRILGRFAGE